MLRTADDAVASSSRAKEGGIEFSSLVEQWGFASSFL